MSPGPNLSGSDKNSTVTYGIDLGDAQVSVSYQKRADNPLMMFNSITEQTNRPLIFCNNCIFLCRSKSKALLDVDKIGQYNSVVNLNYGQFSAPHFSLPHLYM